MWKSLKQILRDSNDKAVIIEDGEPRYVILSFDEYMRMRGDRSVDPPEVARNAPADLAVAQEETRSSAAPHLQKEEINLEDLPF